MSNKDSPLRKLTAEANRIAAYIKAVGRGDIPAKPGSETKDGLKFGIVMDDKIITIELTRAKIEEYSEGAISTMIVKLMREEKNSS